MAKCEGAPDGFKLTDDELYTTDWAQGGPIIHRENIGLEAPDGNIVYWNAVLHDGTTFMGSTPLIAAMRCYVTSKLGDVVEVPKELA